LCPVGDAEAFAERMEWIIENRASAAAIGRRAWELAREDYRGRVAVRQFADLLRETIEQERQLCPGMIHDRYWQCRALLAGGDEVRGTEAQMTAERVRGEPVGASTIEPDLTIGPDLKDRGMRYRLIARKGNLSGLKFQVGTHQTRASGTFMLRVADEHGGETLRTMEIAAEKLSDNSWQRVEFARIVNSRDRSFRIDVSARLTRGRVALYEQTSEDPSWISRVQEKLLRRRSPQRSAFVAEYDP